MLILIACFFGCVSLAGSPPKMPNYKTTQGRECARSVCQITYQASTTSCMEAAAFDITACINNQNAILNDCYLSCE